MITKKWKIITYLIVFFISPFLLQCATNPVTKTYDFILISNAQEVSIGANADKEVLNTYGQYSDPKLQEYINEVGQRVANVSDRRNIEYFFTIVDSPEKNAFALPGGYIYITRGILALINNEAQLAGVLGHEIGHVCARHSAKQISQAYGYQILMLGSSIFLPQLRQWSQISDIIFGSIQNGFGRQYEFQSDDLGENYAFRAGYDPAQSAAFLTALKNTEKEGGEQIFHGIFASHPETEDRIKRALAHSSELKPASTGELKILDDKYVSMLQGLVYGKGGKEGAIVGDSYKNRSYQFALSLPLGWDSSIEKGNLISKDPDGISAIKLEHIPTRGSLTPLQAAEKWEEKNRLKKFEGSSSVINTIDTYTGFYDARSPKGESLKLKVLFFIRNRAGFALICDSPARDFPFVLKDFDRTIYSLRTISEKESAELRIKHLNIYTVEAGDDLKKIAEKFLGDKKKAIDLAKLNGLEVDSPLRVGKKLKVPSF